MVKQTVTHLAVEDLLEHPGNIRDDLGDLTEFAASIQQHGILQPITVTEHPDGRYVLLTGHRRLAAARLAGLTRVPAIIHHGVTDVSDQLVIMLVENCHRREISPMERADAYDALRTQGLTAADIAQQTGVTLSTVYHYLRLLDLPQDEQDAIRAGYLSVTRAVADAVEERQEDRRRRAGRPVGRPPGRKTAPYFGTNHPLADEARRVCTNHRGRVKVGGIACGPCWELTIRLDSLAAEDQEPTS